MQKKAKNKDSGDPELLELGWTYVKTILKTKKFVKKVYRKDKDEFMLKIIPKKNVFNDRSLRRSINREISIVNKVKGNFNFLVGFYDFFYTRNLAIFVYEYYEFGTIQNIFMNDKMTLLEVILLMRDLFNGLEELKHMKIIHKNLNPDCIYMSKNTLKIGGYEYCEFNDCHKMDEFDHNYFVSNLGQQFHTVPPEVLFNKMCGVKTPLFAFGVIFYKLLHQKNPTDSHNLQHMIDGYNSKEHLVDFRKDLPPEFAFILRNSLEVTYEYRISPYELKQELNYLCSFIKGKEEELRLAVFNRRRVNGVDMANFFEPGHVDDQDSILLKNQQREYGNTSVLQSPSRSMQSSQKAGKYPNSSFDNKGNFNPSNLSYMSKNKQSRIRSGLRGGRRFRQQKISLKPFMPGYSKAYAQEQQENHHESSHFGQSDKIKLPISRFGYAPEMSIHSFSRADGLEDKLDELINT